MFENIGQMLVLLWRTIQALPQTWRQRQKIYDQLFEIGNASLLLEFEGTTAPSGVVSEKTAAPE